MKLQLIRSLATDKSVLGILYIDDTFECFTLEDVVRDYTTKIPDKTAIPHGIYELVITYSTRFKRLLPLLLNVPNYEGVRIHPGNTAEDTSGCILVGTVATKDKVLNSRIAFEAFYAKLIVACSKGKQFIEIK